MIKARNPLLIFQRTWEEIELETLRKVLSVAEADRNLAFDDLLLVMGEAGQYCTPALRGYCAGTIDGVRGFAKQLVRKARVLQLLLKLDSKGELQ